VIADGAHVETHHVGGPDGRLVVEVARDDRAGADRVAGVHGDRAFGMRARRARQVRAQPGGATRVLLGRLEVPVEVVHSEELKLDGAGGRRRRGLVGAGTEAEERDQDGAGERGRARK
jgi:hypothetical protein